MEGKQKKILFAVGGILLMFIILWITAIIMVDEDRIASDTINVIEKLTGYKTELDSVEFSFIPAKITIRKLRIKNHPQATTTEFASVDNITLVPRIFSIFSGDISIKSVHIDTPRIAAELFPDGHNNWSFISSISGLNIGGRGAPEKIVISDGIISYTDGLTQQYSDIDDIDLLFQNQLDTTNTSGNQYRQTIEASLMWDNRRISLDSAISVERLDSLAEFITSVDATIKHNNEHISYRGKVHRTTSNIYFDGNMDAHFDNPFYWIKKLGFGEVINSMENNASLQESGGANSNIPVSLKLSLKSDDNMQHLSNLEMDIADIVITGKVDIASEKDSAGNREVIAKLNIAELDISREARQASMANNNLGAVASGIVQGLLSLPMNADIDFSVDSLKMGEDFDGRLSIKGMVEENEMVVNQGTYELPGEGQMLVFGILRGDNLKRGIRRSSLNFDGNIEIIGKDFRGFSDALIGRDVGELTGHKGKYRAKANIYVSEDKAIISALKFQAGDLFFTGGVNINQDNSSAIAATLRVRGLKVDPLIKKIADSDIIEAIYGGTRISKNDIEKESNNTGNGGNNNVPTKSGTEISEEKALPHLRFSNFNRRLPWLEYIGMRVIVELALENFTYDDMQGKNSYMHLTFSKNLVEARNIRVNIGDIKFKGDVTIDQRSQRPKLIGRVLLSSFSLGILTGDTIRKFPVPRGNRLAVWSEKDFNPMFLKGYDADLKMRIGRITHNDFVLRNAAIDVKAKDGLWDIRRISGSIWDGNMVASAKFDISSIPSLNATFQFNHVEASKLLKAFANQDNIRGKIVFNGEVSMAGIDPYSWIRNLNGNFVIAGRNISVRGFNLANVVQSIPSVRSVGDVVNIVRVAMLKQKTTFSEISGGFYAENGKLRTQKIKLVSKHVIGTMSGELDLVLWMMNLDSSFKLVSLVAQDPPALGVSFVDSIDDPRIILDTRDIEAFISRRKVR